MPPSNGTDGTEKRTLRTSVSLDGVAAGILKEEASRRGLSRSAYLRLHLRELRGDEGGTVSLLAVFIIIGIVLGLAIWLGGSWAVPSEGARYSGTTYIVSLDMNGQPTRHVQGGVTITIVISEISSDPLEARARTFSVTSDLEDGSYSFDLTPAEAGGDYFVNVAASYGHAGPLGDSFTELSAGAGAHVTRDLELQAEGR